MIDYVSNISLVVGSIKKKLTDLQQNPDQMLRTTALAVLPALKKRVHVEGLDSNGSQIGTYSDAYMKVRTGNYRNASKVTRGKNKGNLKDAGTFTKGASVDKARPKYNRTSDPKVIFSLTRQMENDESVVATSTGYGIGFNNAFNFEKSQHVEKLFKKPVWKLTEEEKQLAKHTAENFINEYLNQQ